MTTVLSAFCEAAGIPDPFAALAERARANVEAFRGETRRLLRWDWPCSDRDLQDEDYLGGLVANMRAAIMPQPPEQAWYVRALSEALGHSLPPSVEEERAHAYRLAQLAVDITVPPFDLLVVVQRPETMTDAVEVARVAGERILARGREAQAKARALVAELTGLEVQDG